MENRTEKSGTHRVIMITMKILAFEFDQEIRIIR
jgi:hypothetical protein